MSIVAGEANRQCPRCHLLMRRFLTTEPSRVESPVCRSCFYKALVKVPVPYRDPALPPMVANLRAMGRDRTQERPTRVFALSILEDNGQGDPNDVSLLRLLEGGYSDREIEQTIPGVLSGTPQPLGLPAGGSSQTEQATGAHGAAFPGLGASEAALDAAADLEGGRRPLGDAGESTDKDDQR